MPHSADRVPADTARRRLRDLTTGQGWTLTAVAAAVSGRHRTFGYLREIRNGRTQTIPAALDERIAVVHDALYGVMPRYQRLQSYRAANWARNAPKRRHRAARIGAAARHAADYAAAARRDAVVAAHQRGATPAVIAICHGLSSADVAAILAAAAAAGAAA